MDLRTAVKLLEANRPPVLKSDKQVDLSSKQIGDTGANSLFKALLKNHTVARYLLTELSGAALGLKGNNK